MTESCVDLEKIQTLSSHTLKEITIKVAITTKEKATRAEKKQIQKLEDHGSSGHGAAIADTQRTVQCKCEKENRYSAR